MQQKIKLPKLGTHQASILILLLKGNLINNKDVGKRLDTLNSCSRICELRKMGIPIKDKSFGYRTEEGKYVVRKNYYLDSSFASIPEVQRFIKISEKIK